MAVHIPQPDVSVALSFKVDAFNGQTVPTPIVAMSGQPIAHVTDCSINAPLDGVASMTFTVLLIGTPPQ